MTGEVIKRKRKEKGLTQEELGKMLGVNRAAVNKWETGRVQNIKRSKLLLLSQILDISITELVSAEPDKKSTTRIPVLGRVAAGIPIEQITDIMGYEEIPSGLTESADYFALQIKGESMYPRIFDGDIVIVRKQESAENGDIVIASVGNDDATCKRFRKTESGIMLIPLNSNYDPLVFSPEQVNGLPVSILGRVVEIRCHL